MEINLAFADYDFRDNEAMEKIDGLRRSIFQKFRKAIWEKRGDGYVITL